MLQLSRLQVRYDLVSKMVDPGQCITHALEEEAEALNVGAGPSDGCVPTGCVHRSAFWVTLVAFEKPNSKYI